MREIPSEYLEEMLRDRVGARIRRGDELVSLGAERAIVVRRVRVRPQESNLTRLTRVGLPASTRRDRGRRR